MDLNFIEQWGNETDTTIFYRPERIVLDSNGYVYVSDAKNYGIKKLNKDGSVAQIFGHIGIEGDTDGYFNYLEGLAVDSAGIVYASDRKKEYYINSSGKKNSRYYSRIQKFMPNGNRISTDTFTSNIINYAEALAVNDSGHIYVVDSWNARIVVLNSNMEKINHWGKWGLGAGSFSTPENIIIDESGNIFVVDSENCTIQKFTSDGKLIGKWGTVGYGKLSFWWPTGIALNSAGKIYVADEDQCILQRFEQ